MKISKKLKLLGFIVFAVIFWAVIFKNISSDFFDFGGDSAQYIILAESIVSGKGFTMTNYPGAPFCVGYPPVFSIILSPIIYFFGRNFYLMQILIASLGFISVILVYKLFKKKYGFNTAFIVSSLFIFNWNFIHNCTKHILSDIPYLFFSIVFFCLFIRYEEEKNTNNKKLGLVLITLILSFFCRYVGLFLLLAIITVLILKKQFKKTILITVIFFIVLGLWNAINKFTLNPFTSNSATAFFLINNYDPSQGTLFKYPMYFIFRFVDGVNYYSEIIGQLIFSYIFFKWIFLKSFFSFTALGLVLLGFWAKFRVNKNCIFHYYFIGYLLFLTLSNSWLANEGARYMLPILPFLFLYFFMGIKKILTFLPKKVFYLIYSVVFVLVFISNIKMLSEVLEYSLPEYSSVAKNFVSVHQWIEKNLPEKGVIISRNPVISFFYSGHQSICYPFSFNPDDTWQEILKNRVKYIVVDEFSRETYSYLVPFVYKNRDRFKVLRRVGRTVLLEVIKVSGS